MTTLASYTIINGNWQLTIRPNGAAFNSEQQGTRISLGANSNGVALSGKNGTGDVARLAYKEVSAGDSLLQPLRLREHSEYDISLVIPLPKAECVRQWKRNQLFPFSNPKLQKILSFNGPDACEYQTNHCRITGRLKIGSQAGMLDLSLEPAFCNLRLVVSVVSAKINYEDEFRCLVNDLADIHAEMILHLDSPTEVSLVLDEQQEPSTQTRILHLRRLMRDDRLPMAIRTILLRPSYRHRSSPRLEKSAFVSRPDMTNLQSNPASLDWIKDGPLAGVFCGYTPTTLPTHEIQTNYDIVENRFIKYRIKRLLRELGDIADELSGTNRHVSCNSVAKWILLVKSWLQHPFWQNVGECASYPNSMVLLERHGYREVMYSLMAYDQGLKYESCIGEVDPTTGDLRPVYDLYELWCYFQLRSILTDISGVPANPGSERVFTKGTIDVRLKRGAGRFTEFRYKHNIGIDVVLRLYYNRNFAPCGKDNDLWEESYSALLHPDFSVEICAGAISHWVHFDAKYRLDLKQWKGEIGATDQPSEQLVKDEDTYKRIDLHVMHSYRDALLGTRGSYVLYPGSKTTADIFVRHGDSAYRTGFPGPGVGAFPLRPCRNRRLSQQLETISGHITHLINAAVICSRYGNEQGFILPTR